MREPMSEEDFAAKIHWEGGIMDALDYGLRSEDVVPGDLHNLWEELEGYWAQMQSTVYELDDYVGELLDGGA